MAKPKQLTEGERFLAGRCPQLIKVSKHLAGQLALFPGDPCKCECEAGDKPQSVFQLRYRARLLFKSVKPCDESDSDALIPDGAELWLTGTLTLRQDVCGQDKRLVLIGCNHGTFDIFRPGSGDTLFKPPVPFCGTEGFQPTGNGPERCC